MPVTPEMVLGKAVVTPLGAKLGEIVDVGTHDHRRVKFLLVDDARGAEFVRLAVDLIATIDDGSVVLKAGGPTEAT